MSIQQLMLSSKEGNYIIQQWEKDGTISSSYDIGNEKLKHDRVSYTFFICDHGHNLQEFC